MPQTFSMFNDLTVYENLCYFSAVYNVEKSQIDKIIKKCFLQEQKNTLASNLSGGYKQLLSLAGAIIHNPDLLILDEPTSAMDPLFRNMFWKTIHELNSNGKTILLITHYVEEVNQCNNVLCLSNGKIVYDGSPEKFKKDGMFNIEELLKINC